MASMKKVFINILSLVETDLRLILCNYKKNYCQLGTNYSLIWLKDMLKEEKQGPILCMKIQLLQEHMLMDTERSG